MSNIISPGTICIVTYTPSGADMGRLVVVMRYGGARWVGRLYMPEAYLTRCVAGRPFHSVHGWRPDGSYIDLKNRAYIVWADRSQLRPLPGIEDSDEQPETESRPLEVTI